MTRKKNSGDNFGFPKPKNIRGLEKPKNSFNPRTPIHKATVSQPLLADPKLLELIKQAIIQKLLIKFYYQDFQRIAEPHILGLKDGVLQVLVRQVDGQSNSGLVPDWRRMNLENILSLQILDETFSSNPSNLYESHSSWDEIIAIVS